MIKQLILLACCLLSLTSGYSSEDSIFDSISSPRTQFTYQNLVEAELSTKIFFTIPSSASTSWTLSSLAQTYYGATNYWPILRAANPQFMRDQGYAVWSQGQQNAVLKPGFTLVFPSLLTCVEFLPITCISRGAQLLNSITSYIGTVVLDLETAQMADFTKIIYDETKYNALSTLQITLSWLTDTWRDQDQTAEAIQQAEIAFAVQGYHMRLETPSMVNITIINQGNIDFNNAQIYQPTGMGMASIPGNLSASNAVSLFSVENENFGGTSGILVFGQLGASATSLPGLLLEWEVKNSEVFPNKVTINTLKSTGNLTRDYINEQFDTTYLVDETITGQVLNLVSNNYYATVQISHSRICQIIITLGQTSAGKIYNSSLYYSFTNYPVTGLPTQCLWFDGPNVSQDYVGLIQFDLDASVNKREQWILYQVQNDIYNIQSVCDGIYLQANSSSGLLSYALNRTTSQDIQWNFINVGNYVLIQSMALPDHCLTGSYETSGSWYGIHALPIYLSPCDENDYDQYYGINGINTLGAKPSSCPYNLTSHIITYS